MKKSGEVTDMTDDMKLPLTIERHLERYATADKHTQRHEVLWHTWYQNKRWIVQLLESTAMSFPMYSKHDESHAETVLHNIELILGEDRIATLSATDCFVILHTVYIHDIGMTITAAERKEIVSNDHFMKMVDYLEREGDADIRRSVSALKRRDYSEDTASDFHENMRRLYEAKLEIYTALVNLVATYRRSEHGEKSRDRLYQWTLESDKLGTGFSLAGMPQRIFLTIAECARMHTEPEFDEIYRLPQEDDGYVFDYMHPRFVSLLLQLGDLLDMDNDRFHPLAISNMDEYPMESVFHYKKHLSIRTLHIRPESIRITADCDSQEALRIVRKECDMLVGILKQAGYAWPNICPHGFPGALPTVREVSLYLNGHPIPQELVTTRFEIPQKKAFEILEGANFYANRFAFLREFLQNALDATKMQYWKECMHMSGSYNDVKTCDEYEPYELEKIVSTKRFPIEIEMEIYKRDRSGELSPLTKMDLENFERDGGAYTWGILVTIKDYGTGIGKDDLKLISRVGTSIDKEQKEISYMPEWLKPTAEFGVGMQSAFLITNVFRCYTHTRMEERYEISFGTGAIDQYGGYINVKPISVFEKRKYESYGSCFEIFVPENKKLLHEQFPKSWDGRDPFSEDYEKLRPLRHAAELMAQMTMFLDSLVGETSIFPIRLLLIVPEKIVIPININEKNKIHHIELYSESMEGKWESD